MAVTLQQVREQYPEYDDMSDKELADALYGKFYSDMDQNEFYSLVGIAPDEEEEDEDKPGYARGRLAGVKAGFNELVAQGADTLATPGRMMAALSGRDPDKARYELAGVPLTDIAEDQRYAAELERDIQQRSTPEGGAAQFGTELLDSAINMAPSVITTYLTKKGDLGLGVMGAQTFATAMTSSLNEGKSNEEALKDAAVATALELGPEKMFGFFDELPVAKGVKQWLQQVVAEATSEGATETGTILDERYRQGEDIGSFGETLARTGRAAGAGAVMGGTFAAPALMGSAEAPAQEAPAELPPGQPVPPISTPPQQPVPPVEQPTQPPVVGGQYGLFDEVAPEQTELGFDDIPGPDQVMDQLNLDFGGEPEWLPAENTTMEDALAAWERYKEEQTYNEEELAALLPAPEPSPQMEMFAEPEGALQIEGSDLPTGFPEQAPAVPAEALAEESVSDIDRIQWVKDTLKETFTPEAQRWAVLARPENVPYSKGGAQGTWEVKSYDPGSGRVIAEFEGTNGKLAYTWVLDESQPEPFPMYKQKDGTYTYRHTYNNSRFAKDTPPPKKFLKEANDALRIGVQYGMPDVDVVSARKLERTNRLRGVSQVLFHGAQPIESVLVEEQAQARKSGQAFDEQEVRGRQKAQIKILQERNKGFVVSKKIPQLKEDGRAKVVTLINQNDNAKIAKGTATFARAYQVLPNGDVRTLTIMPNERRTGYVIVADAVSGKTFAAPKTIGKVSIKGGLRPSAKEALNKLPGRTIAEKNEQRLAAIRTESGRAAAEAQAAAEARPLPNEVTAKTTLPYASRKDTKDAIDRLQLPVDKDIPLEARGEELQKARVTVRQNDLLKYVDGLVRKTLSKEDSAAVVSDKKVVKVTEALAAVAAEENIPDEQIHNLLRTYWAIYSELHPEFQQTDSTPDSRNAAEAYQRFEARAAEIARGEQKAISLSRLQAWVKLMDDMVQEYGITESVAESMLGTGGLLTPDMARAVERLAAARKAESKPTPSSVVAQEASAASKAAGQPYTEAEQDLRQARNKVPAERRTEAEVGRPLKTGVGTAQTRALEKSLREYQASETFLRDTIAYIRSETGSALRSAARKRSKALKDIYELREAAGEARLSKEAADKLKSLEKAAAQGQKSIDKLLDKEAAETARQQEEDRQLNQELRDEMRKLNLTMAREVKTKADDELARLERVKTPLDTMPYMGAKDTGPKTPVPQTAAEIEQEARAKQERDDTQLELGASEITPEYTKDMDPRDIEALEKELQASFVQRDVRQLSLELAADTEWQKQSTEPIQPKAVPTKQQADPVSVTTGNPVETATFVKSTAQAIDRQRNKRQRSSKFPRLRRYANIFTRYASLPKSQRAIVDDQAKLFGGIKLGVMEARRHFHLALVSLNKAGWNRNDKNWNNALNAYIEGAAPEYIQEEYGVAIPEDAQTHLAGFRKDTIALAQSGVFAGSWERPSVRGPINNGRAYLHHIAKQTQLTADQLEDNIVELGALARVAFGLPETVEDVRKLSMSQVLSLLNNTTHDIWNKEIRPAPVEQRGAKSSANHLQFSYGGTTFDLGPATDGAITKKGVETRLGKVPAEAKPAAKAELLRQLQDLIILKLPTKETYEIAVKGMVDNYSTTSTTALARGKGADRSIQKQRLLMKSHAERVADAKGRVRESLPEAERLAFDEFVQDMGDISKMTLGSFMRRVKAQYPNNKGVLRSEAEARLADKLREAINEVTDTETLMSRTAEAVASTVYTSVYLQKFMVQGLSNGFASLKERASADWVQLAKEGTALGDATFHLPGTTQFVKGSEVYATAEAVSVVQEAFGQDAGRELGSFNKGFRIASGYVKYGKVVLNALAHLRNVVSTRMVHWRQNLVGYGAARAKRLGLKLSAGQVRSTLGSKQEAKAETNKSKEVLQLQRWMLRRNVLYDGGHAGAVYDLFHNSLGAANAVTRDTHLLKEKAARGKNAVDEWFRLEDESVKGPAFLMALAERLALLGKDGSIIDKGLRGEDLSAADSVALNKALDWAAEHVLQTYPTFSRVSPFFKMTSRSPILGAFPSFSFEMARTSVNLVVHTAEMVHAAATGKMFDGTPVSRKVAAIMASTKLAQQTAMYSVGAVVAQTITAMAYDGLFGDDDDDEDKSWYEDIPSWPSFALNGAYRLGDTAQQRQERSLLPWYARGGMSIISAINPDTGDYTTMQVDYALPTGAWEAALMKGYLQLSDALENKDAVFVAELATAVAGQMEDMFFGEEVLFGAIRKRWQQGVPNTYDTDRAAKKFADYLHRKITDDGYTESWLLEGAGAVISGLTETAPGTDSLQQGLDLVEWTADKLWGEDDPEAAQVADSFAATLGHLIGFKQRDVPFKEKWPQMFARDQRSFYMADSRMRTHLATSTFNSYEEFEAAFSAQNVVRRQEFDVLFYSMSAAKQHLGRSRGDISRAIRDTSVKKKVGGSTLTDIERGRYRPPSSKAFRDVLDKKVEDRAERRQKELWYRQAYREAGYELSEFE